MVPLDYISRSGPFICLSGGLGYDWSFELDGLDRGVFSKCIFFDRTVDKLRYLREATDDLLNLRLRHAYFVLNALIRYLKFKDNGILHVKKNLGPTDTARDISLSSVIKLFSDSQDMLLLKLDIEGSEYKVLGGDTLLTTLERVDVFVIEFHDLDIYQSQFIKLLTFIQEKFLLIHTHANNHSGTFGDKIPRTVELTLINKSQLQKEEWYPRVRRNSLPIENLDFPNAPLKPDVNWF